MVPLLVVMLACADDPFEPPVVGRPEGFRGAVGLFRLHAEAETKNAVVGKSLRYTIRVTARPDVPVHSPPTRPEVEDDPEFKKRFFFEKPDPPGAADVRKGVWEFYYLLKPKSEAVKEIPEMPFCYFNPQAGNDPKGYAEDFTKPIPLTVAPKLAETPKVEGDAVPEYAEPIRWYAHEDSLLKRHRPFTMPNSRRLLALLGGPPLAALGWLLIWRRLHPDAARLANRRRSRAAREALQSLRGARGEQGGPLAERVAGVVTCYLSQRYDLTAAAPTPAEVDGFLRAARMPDPLREQAAALLQTCDALRFSAMPPAVSGGLVDSAEKLILDLEAQSWSPPS